jgi:hypothetical protein
MHHRECWEYNQGCAVYGCSLAPSTEPLTAAEIPASYWGQDDKACPSCGQKILAAAVRCRFCGAVFDADPQDASDYQARSERRARVPALRRSAVIILLAGIIPCTAPLAALGGGLWLLGHRQDLRAVPAVHTAMAWIGVGAGTLQTVAAVIVTIVLGVLGK